MTILVDEMDNAVWCSYGGRPNNAYLIGIDGKVVASHYWYSPELMGDSIDRYLEGINR